MVRSPPPLFMALTPPRWLPATWPVALMSRSPDPLLVATIPAKPVTDATPRFTEEPVPWLVTSIPAAPTAAPPATVPVTVSSTVPLVVFSILIAVAAALIDWPSFAVNTTPPIPEWFMSMPVPDATLTVALLSTNTFRSSAAAEVSDCVWVIVPVHWKYELSEVLHAVATATDADAPHSAPAPIASAEADASSESPGSPSAGA